MTECKFYDTEFNCCKLFSDWSQAMPILQPCVEGACSEYKPIKECDNNAR